MSETLPELEIADGVATLTLDRPALLNALSIETIRGLRRRIAEIAGRSDVRALVLTGRGRAFCVGADLSDPVISLDGPLEERAGKLARLMRDDINPLVVELAGLAIPKIAAVNGPAVGAGLGLALAADIVIAAKSAYFMQVFTPKLGLVPDMGVTWHLPRLIGRARAIAWSMLGERLPAEKAVEWGLVWKAVPDDTLMAEATAVARQLAGGPTLALALLPQLIDEAAAADLAGALEAEADAQCRLVATADAQEAVLAFRAKRAATFHGR